MIYHGVCNKNNTKGATWTTYQSKAPKIAPVFLPVLEGFVLLMLSNYIFSSGLWYPIKNYAWFILTLICIVGVHVLFMLFVSIYVHWCPKRFPYQMMIVSFYSNTIGVTCAAGSAKPEFTHGY